MQTTTTYTQDNNMNCPICTTKSSTLALSPNGTPVAVVEISGNDLVRLDTTAIATDELDRFDEDDDCKWCKNEFKTTCKCFGSNRPIKQVYESDTAFVSVLSQPWVITRWDDRFVACKTIDLVQHYGHLLLDNAFLLNEDHAIIIPLVQTTSQGIIVVAVLGVNPKNYSKLKSIAPKIDMPRQPTAPLFWETSFRISMCHHKQLCNIDDQLWVLFAEQRTVSLGRVRNKQLCSVRRYNVEHPILALHYHEEVAYILTVDEKQTTIHRWNVKHSTTTIVIDDFQAIGFAFEEHDVAFMLVYDKTTCRVYNHNFKICHTFHMDSGNNIERAWIGVRGENDVWVLIQQEDAILRFLHESFSETEATYTMTTPGTKTIQDQCLFVMFEDTLSNAFVGSVASTFEDDSHDGEVGFICTVYLANNEKHIFALVGAHEASTRVPLVSDKREGISAVSHVPLHCTNIPGDSDDCTSSDCIIPDDVVLFGTNTGMVCYTANGKVEILNSAMPVAIRSIDTVRVGPVVYVLCSSSREGEQHLSLFGINDGQSHLSTVAVLEDDVCDNFLKDLHVVSSQSGTDYDPSTEALAGCWACGSGSTHRQHVLGHLHRLHHENDHTEDSNLNEDLALLKEQQLFYPMGLHMAMRSRHQRTLQDGMLIRGCSDDNVVLYARATPLSDGETLPLSTLYQVRNPMKKRKGGALTKSK